METIRQKAKRGELRFCLPVGLCWGTAGNIELNPDVRVQNAIHLVLQKFQELGSARQVLLWCRERQIALPALGDKEDPHHICRKLPVDDGAQEVVLVIRWIGGRHSELRVTKLKTGEHSHCTKPEAVDIVRQMSGGYTNEQIARTLNRGNTWSEARVRSLREHLKFPAYRYGPPEDRVKMLQAAQRLGVSTTLVRRLIGDKILPATQIVPWEIDSQAVASPVVMSSCGGGKESR